MSSHSKTLVKCDKCGHKVKEFKLQHHKGVCTGKGARKRPRPMCASPR